MLLVHTQIGFWMIHLCHAAYQSLTNNVCSGFLWSFFPFLNHWLHKVKHCLIVHWENAREKQQHQSQGIKVNWRSVTWVAWTLTRLQHVSWVSSYTISAVVINATLSYSVPHNQLSYQIGYKILSHVVPHSLSCVATAHEQTPHLHTHSHTHTPTPSCLLLCPSVSSQQNGSI